MNLLRAIPFSFAILWRLILVFPFMLIGLIALGILVFFLMIILALVSPVLAFILAICFGVAATVFPSMVGMRLGLQAKGASVRNSYLGLMLPAIGYGLFEAICVLLIMALAGGIYLVATPLSLQDLGQFAAMDEAVIFEQLMAVNPAVTLSLLWVGGVLIIGLRAALLMPFAGASIGADPSGRPHTPFYGFGSDFLSLLILVAICYILWTFTIPIALWVCFMLGYGENLTAALMQLEKAKVSDGAQLLSLFGVEMGVFLGTSLLLFLWTFSLQCAGGVLVYMNYVRDLVDQQQAFDMSMDAHLEATSPSVVPQHERHVQSEDVMELIRSRMQNKKK